MTTKPKPRKRPAMAAPVKPAPAGTPREVSEIEKLSARLKWLEADQIYQSGTASTEEECNKLLSVHVRERDKIESRLAELRPTTMEEVRLLLEFVQISFEGGSGTDGTDIRIVANVRDSLIEVRRNIEEKARDEAYKESLEHAADAIMKIVGLQRKFKRLSAEPKKTTADA
jgi:hypothetical protein